MTIPPLLIQRGTINDSPNPDFATDINGWGSNGMSGTITGSWAWHDNGTDPSLRLTVTSTSGNGAASYSAVTAPGTYAGGDPATFWVAVQGDGVPEAMIWIDPKTAANANLTRVSGTATAMTGDEQILVVSTSALPAGTDHVLINIQARFVNGAQGAATFDVFRNQIEKHPKPTAFTIGTRPDRRSSGFLVPGTRITPLTPH